MVLMVRYILRMVQLTRNRDVNILRRPPPAILVAYKTNLSVTSSTYLRVKKNYDCMKMFGRFASTLRPVRNAGSVYRFHRRRSSGWSRHTGRKNTVLLISVAGAIGTVAVYKLTTLDPPLVDYGDWKSNISSLLRPTCASKTSDSR